MAATALSAGATVSLRLIGEASWLAVPGRAEDQVLAGVRIAGAASFVDEVLRDDAQALVY